ncbi:hypothetical protein R1flu_004488 [Riccia fluitans]|uniref:Uncharacterized protein n=1 Tax=Riccia fluitans TaxID=41844 RepID=A0ABD1YTC4_9MARC
MGTPDHARAPCPDRMILAVRINARRIGGSFAVWGGLFSTFDCSMVYLRQKEVPWNSIAAGAATGGFLQLRAGVRSATRSAVFGGVLLVLIEGAGIMLNRLTANMAQPPPLEEPMPQMNMPGAPYPTAATPYARQPTNLNVDEWAGIPPIPSNLGGPTFEERKLDSECGITPSPADPSSSSSGGSSWWGGIFGVTKEEEGIRA